MIKKDFLLLFFTFFVVFVSACYDQESDSTTQATYRYSEEIPALAVNVLEVSTGALIQKIRVSGIVKGKNEVDVISETTGIITSVSFESGDFVKKGTPLLKVDDSIALFNKNQAALDLETARLDLEAKEKFYKSGNTSLLELTKAKSIYNGQKARYEIALKAYNDCTIRAPLTGIVARREEGISAGNYLVRGRRITRIIDISSFILEVGVGERQVVLIETGASAAVDVPAAGEKQMPAKVVSIAGGGNEETGSYSVLISWENNMESSVKSGMSAFAYIQTEKQDSGIIIPFSSFIFREGQPYVFVVKDNKAEAVVVSVGERFGERIVVSEGPGIGDLLIISRISSLKPGYPVSATIIGKTGEWE
jgi:membrane fusion protein (multidrug efflux system)